MDDCGGRYDEAWFDVAVGVGDDVRMLWRMIRVMEETV